MASRKKKPVVSLMAQSCADFSSVLHKTASRKSEGNIITSPLSAHVLLSYLLYGCNGKTAEEIKAALNLSDTQGLHLEYRKITETLNNIAKNMVVSWDIRVVDPNHQRPGDASDEVVVNLANAIFVQEDVALQKHFASVGKECFQFAVKPVNFVDKFGSAKRINSWISEKTGNMIQKIIEPGSINFETKLVLVNTIYLKAQWQNEFATICTRNRVFHVTDTLTKEVPTMSRMEDLYSGTIPSWKSRFLHKPYELGDLDMTIILPDTIDGLKFVEERFDWNVISKAKTECKRTELRLPKFNIESEIDLEKVFNEMKMKSMFEPRGELEGICSISMKPPLKVDRVIQKCCVEVTEKGTVAAAVTVMRLCGGGCLKPPPKPIEFFVDRPFIIVIRHVPSNIPLFVSSVKDIGENLKAIR